MKLYRILRCMEVNLKGSVVIVALLVVRHKIAEIKVNTMKQMMEISAMELTALIVFMALEEELLY